MPAPEATPIPIDAVEETAGLEEFVPPAEPQRPLQTIEAALPQKELLRDEIVAPPSAEAMSPAAPELVAPEPTQPRVILPKKKSAATPLPTPVTKPASEKIVQAKQEVLQFESVTRGRFEKSEPTIVEGQDLDVPTFLRKNVRVK